MKRLAFVVLFLAACVSAKQPLDASKIGDSIRTEIAEHDSYIVAIRDEVAPAVKLAIEQTGEGPAKAVLVALKARLDELNANPDDKIGRGRLLLLAVDEAQGKVIPSK